MATWMPWTVVSRSRLMSLIITFMFEPAKLQMNWARASGMSTCRKAPADRLAVLESVTEHAPPKALAHERSEAAGAHSGAHHPLGVTLRWPSGSGTVRPGRPGGGSGGAHQREGRPVTCWIPLIPSRAGASSGRDDARRDRLPACSRPGPGVPRPAHVTGRDAASSYSWPGNPAHGPISYRRSEEP